MTVQATYAATLVDEWVRAGVRHAVVSPGSRSTPLAVALARDSRITIHVRLDERSGAFFAIGLAHGSRAPVIIVTTSGTAAAELHPGVVEADLAGVPLICCTADRPAELHDIGSSQTINQSQIFGSSTRFFCEPGVPETEDDGYWRSLAARLAIESTSSPKGPGPVHVNLAFRDPLVGETDVVGPGRRNGEPWHRAAGAPALRPNDVENLMALIGREKKE